MQRRFTLADPWPKAPRSEPTRRIPSPDCSVAGAVPCSPLRPLVIWQNTVAGGVAASRPSCAGGPWFPPTWSALPSPLLLRRLLSDRPSGAWTAWEWCVMGTVGAATRTNPKPATTSTPARIARGDRLFWGRAAQVRAARRFVLASLAANLAQAGDTAGVEVDRDVVALLVSEMVTNAVLHSASGRADGTLLVRYELELAATAGAGTGRLRVTVRDLGGPTMPRRCRHELESTGRRGLEVVEALASRWGVGQHPRGRVVWFELDLKAKPVRTGRSTPA